MNRGGGISMGTLFIIVFIVWALAQGGGGNGSGGGNKPQPQHSAVCNQYFKGGC